jgi:integrase/recombinase XerC
MKFSKTAARAKDIDLILPGLGFGTGRNKDRFRVSSETTVAKVYEARRQMVKDLADRLLFGVLRARVEGRFTTTELYRAYREGQSALDRLVENSSGMLLEPLLRRYMTVNRARDRAKTEKQVRRFIDWCGDPDRATTNDLTSDRLADFLAGLTSRRGHAGGAVSGATYNRYRAAIGGFCTYLVRQGYLSKHPVAFRALPKADEGESRMPEFSPAEYRDYFAAVATLTPDLLPVYRLLVHTGADVGEVLSRTVRDCDLDRELPRIRFRRTKTRTPERLVPFPPLWVAELRGHIAAHRLQPGDLLFGMFKRSAVEWVHQRARKGIGRPDLRLKDFRHIAAIAWRRGGADLESVRDWLGHATINQTVVYNAFVPDDGYDAPKVARAAEILSAAAGVLHLRAAS